MALTSDSQSLFVSKWFWIPMVIGGAFVASANAVTDAIRFRVLDDTPLPGTLPHLGSGGEVYLTDADRAPIAENSERKKHGVDSERSIQALIIIGHVASHEGNREVAIAAFKKAIETPDSLPKRRQRVWWDIDYDELHKHAACVELSDLFLEMGDLASALKYTELALDTYKFSSPCGSANWTIQYELQERINAIRSALAGGQPVAIEPRSTALARQYSSRRGPPPPNPPGRLR